VSVIPPQITILSSFHGLLTVFRQIVGHETDLLNGPDYLLKLTEKKFPNFVGTEDSILCSQDIETSIFLEPVEFSPNINTVTYISVARQRHRNKRVQPLLCNRRMSKGPCLSNASVNTFPAETISGLSLGNRK
jgi:hypothetical protein